ncbi:hypothetical protein SNEBB_001102, partial [Seison nebaliae]
TMSIAIFRFIVLCRIIQNGRTRTINIYILKWRRFKYQLRGIRTSCTLVECFMTAVRTRRGYNNLRNKMRTFERSVTNTKRTITSIFISSTRPISIF